ncbi:MAG TPA: hypothetical protein VG225_02485 [Terracidiphilus sp.]|jgi:hypothetical protein|nr:hypothetical protein [Terracidiphilus sp.]
MRKWGIVVSLLYALIVVVLLGPVWVFLLGGDLASLFSWNDIRGALGFCGVPAAMLIAGQSILLFLSIDTSQKRLKPRSPVVRTSIIASMLLAMLAFAAILSVGVAIKEANLGSVVELVAIFLGNWILWAIVFYLVLRNSAAPVTAAMSWLLRGSILELLIAVPCHVIVRRRNDCSAPLATSFGIVTGIAVMLLSFGPIVLLLYKRRLDAYRHPGQERGEPHAPVHG